MADLINLYYATDAEVAGDKELQVFASDAVNNGKVVGFPSTFQDRASISQALGYMLYMTSVKHHTKNSFSIGYNGVIPWSSPAFCTFICISYSHLEALMEL
jgi:hypothetical protein